VRVITFNAEKQTHCMVLEVHGQCPLVLPVYARCKLRQNFWKRTR